MKAIVRQTEILILFCVEFNVSATRRTKTEASSFWEIRIDAAPTRNNYGLTYFHDLFHNTELQSWKKTEADTWSKLHGVGSEQDSLKSCSGCFQHCSENIKLEPDAPLSRPLS